MVNRLQKLYDQYMMEKEKDPMCEDCGHQHMMKNLAMEMAAIEYLMKSDIEKHVKMHPSHTAHTAQTVKAPGTV